MQVRAGTETKSELGRGLKYVSHSEDDLPSPRFAISVHPTYKTVPNVIGQYCYADRDHSAISIRVPHITKPITRHKLTNDDGEVFHPAELNTSLLTLGHVHEWGLCNSNLMPPIEQSPLIVGVHFTLQIIRGMLYIDEIRDELLYLLLKSEPNPCESRSYSR